MADPLETLKSLIGKSNSGAALKNLLRSVGESGSKISKSIDKSKGVGSLDTDPKTILQTLLQSANTSSMGKDDGGTASKLGKSANDGAAKVIDFSNMTPTEISTHIKSESLRKATDLVSDATASSGANQIEQGGNPIEIIDTMTRLLAPSGATGALGGMVSGTEEAQTAVADSANQPEEALVKEATEKAGDLAGSPKGFGKTLSAIGVALGAGLVSGSGGDPSAIINLAESQAKKTHELDLEKRKKEVEDRGFDLDVREQDRKEFKDANDLRASLKNGGVDALAPESAGKFALLIEGAEATAELSQMLDSNITKQMFAQGIPNFAKSQEGKAMNSAIERAIQAKTRIESGGEMKDTELKSTAKRFMPQKGDTLKTALKRLKPLNDFFEGSLNIADPTGTHRQRASGKQSSVSVDAIQAEKKRRGL